MLDTSNLVLDLKRFNFGLQLHLAQSVQAFCHEAARPRLVELRAVQAALIRHRLRSPPARLGVQLRRNPLAAGRKPLPGHRFGRF